MKIENLLRNSQTGGTQGARSSRVETPAKGDDADARVRLSSLASQLQAATQQSGASGGFDAARVAEIKLAIAEGRLQINPDVIADRLLESVRELLLARST